MFIGPGHGDPSFENVVSGARAFFRTYPGFEVVTVHPATGTPESLLAAASNALDRQPNAVVIWTDDEEEDAAALRMVHEARAVLVTVGPDTDSSIAMGHVRVDPAQGASLLGENVRQLAGKSLTYMVLHANQRSKTGTRCYDHFMMPARGVASPKLVLEKCETGPLAAQSGAVAEMFDTFSHCGLLITLDPAIWQTGGFRSILGEDNRFATLSAAPPLWPALEMGKAAGLVGVLDGEVGAAAAQMAVRCLASRKKQESSPTIAWELVTRDNLIEFSHRYRKAAGTLTSDIDRAARGKPVESKPKQPESAALP